MASGIYVAGLIDSLTLLMLYLSILIGYSVLLSPFSMYWPIAL